MNIEKSKLYVSVIATILIPIVIVYVSNSFTTELKESELRVKYLELAISILQEEASTSNKGMRTWAVNLLKEYSPVPFVEPETEEELIEEISLPRFDNVTQRMIDEGTAKYSSYGQFGSTCQIAEVETSQGSSPEGEWIKWESNSVISPTTRLGRNIQIHNFSFTLWRNGKWTFMSNNFTNSSRHSDWKTRVELNYVSALYGENARIFNPNIFIGENHLRHGQSRAESFSGELGEVSDYMFNSIASPETKPVVCLWSQRTN